jgi:transposase
MYPHYGYMIKLLLTDQNISDVHEALDDPIIDQRNKNRLLVIAMHHGGANNTFISGCMKLCPNTVTNYLKSYRDGGIGELIENRHYRPSSSLEPFMQCIECCFKTAPVQNAKDAVARIEKMTGIKLSESQARRIMKKMGMSLKKCSSVPAKADPQLQFDFYCEQMKPRLQEASEGLRKVFFVDAAHFVLGAFLGMVWCFVRPFIKTSPGRQRYNVLGAVDSHSKEIISIKNTGYINALTVCELIDEIRRQHAGIAITLILDNAKYQRCQVVMQKADELDVELLFLPAYSPNLNLIERLWKLVKKRCLANRYHENFDKFKNAIDHCLEKLSHEDKAELESLLTLKFQFFTNHKT